MITTSKIIWLLFLGISWIFLGAAICVDVWVRDKGSLRETTTGFISIQHDLGLLSTFVKECCDSSLYTPDFGRVCVEGTCIERRMLTSQYCNFIDEKMRTSTRGARMNCRACQGSSAASAALAIAVLVLQVVLAVIRAWTGVDDELVITLSQLPLLAMLIVVLVLPPAVMLVEQQNFIVDRYGTNYAAVELGTSYWLFVVSIGLHFCALIIGGSLSFISRRHKMVKPTTSALQHYVGPSSEPTQTQPAVPSWMRD